MQVHPLRHQGETDQGEEGEGQHLDGGVVINEIADRLGGKHHDEDGDHDGQHHDRDVISHADGGDHRIQTKDDVENGDLDQGADKTGRGGAHPFRLGCPLKGGVDLQHALADEEQAPQQQDEIAARDGLAQHGKERSRETHDPGQREQQQDAGTHGEGQTQNAGALALRLGQTADQNGDKDDVIDAQHDFEQGQGGERYPGRGIQNPFQHD